MGRYSNSIAMTALGVTMALTMGCEEERDPPGRPVCNAWKTEVSALVQDSCTRCHGQNVREGDYALDEYTEALAPDASGVRRVIPGDPESRILTILEEDGLHSDFSALSGELERWVVTCEARFVKTELHTSGLMVPGAEDFHAQLIRDNFYDFSDCQECHGDDFAGGSANASCISCHPAGPDDCSTCHGDLFDKGAHEIHVMGGALERETDCETCHVVPDDLLSPGHVLTSPTMLDPPPVEVRLTGDAVGPGEGAPTPVYVAAADRCDNVYCHGGTYDDANATMSTPSWNAEGPLGCDSCHGQPPADHPGDDCKVCHVAAVNEDNELADLSLHLDRSVTFAAQEGCGGICHGTEGNPAPAPDLEGRTDPRLVTVGLHDAHLFPRSGLGLAVACEECHRVPREVVEFGHLDGGNAEVFPPVQGVSTLASADNAMPTWNRETATCSDVYCHGGGDTLGADTSPGIVREVVWNDPDSNQVYCGSCHGVPPSTPIHAPIESLTECSGCHPTTVDEFGNILPQGDHLNGSFTD